MANATKSGNGHIEAPAAKNESPKVERLELRVAEIVIPIRGTSPLIVHRFSEKSQKQIEDKQAKKAKEAKAVRDPKAEYLAAFYMMSGPAAGEKNARYGFPAAGFKNAAVDACSFIDGVTKVEARGAFHVIADEGPLVELNYDSVSMRTDTVRVGMGSLDMRYRPEFDGWSVNLRVRYNEAVLSPEQIVNLFNNAGFGVGVGEWRPQKDGSNGMFEVPVSSQK